MKVQFKKFKSPRWVNKLFVSIIVLICYLFLVNHQLSAQTIHSEFAEKDIQEYVSANLLNSKKSHLVMVSNYSYKTFYEWWLRDKKRNTELTETFFPTKYGSKSSRGVAILLEKNGIPLSKNIIEKRRKKVAEELVENESNTQKRPDSIYDLTEIGIPLAWQHFDTSVGLWSFLSSCQFRLKTQSEINGRKTLLLNFDRCNSSALPKEMRYMSNLQGEILSDLDTQDIISLTAWEKGVYSTEKNSPTNSEKIVILFKQILVDNKYWFPKTIKVNALETKHLFSSNDKNWQIQFYDYKLNNVDVEYTKNNLQP